MADFGGDGVGGRVRPDVDQQFGGAVEAAQAYPVGAEWNDGQSTDRFAGLAVWGVGERVDEGYTRRLVMRDPRDTDAVVYEPPTLSVLGSLHELTQTGGDWPCLWKKTIGPPDYVNWIPVTNCSS